MGSSSLRWSVLYGFGMVLVFVGERLIATGNGRWVATLIGLAAVSAATVVRTARWTQAKGEVKRVELTVLVLYIIGMVSLWLYFLQSDVLARLGLKTLEQGVPRLQIALAVLWPALWLLSALPLVLVELAYAAVARAPRLESGRIRDAMLSGFGLAGALIFAISIYYVSAERDKRVDLSYFRLAKPGEATRKLARTFDKPVSVSLFFPPANEVHEEVISYFQDLKRESPQMLEVHDYDFAVDPGKAKELGVTANGTVAIARGPRHELLTPGLEMESARTTLKSLDREVQKRLLQVAKPGRTVYLISGHNERGDTARDSDKRPTIRDLRELLLSQGYLVKSLSAAEGLATEVPADATCVLMIGPEKRLLAEEVGALTRYVDRGGRMMIALDPEAGLDFKELLQPLGIQFFPVMLANDEVYARKTFQLSDRGNIATGTYSSHPSVTSLSHLGMRAPMILVGAGHLEDAKERPKDVSIDHTVRSLPSTWADLNRNFQFDAPAESRRSWNLAVAVTKRKSEAIKPGDKPGKPPGDEGRVIVLADSDAVADGVVGNPGNAYFVVDGVKWLLGDEAIAGEISSEIDVPIAHTRKQDTAWFYSSIFLAPALVLGAGWAATRRRRKSGRPGPGQAAAPAPKEAGK